MYSFNISEARGSSSTIMQLYFCMAFEIYFKAYFKNCVLILNLQIIIFIHQFQLSFYISQTNVFAYRIFFSAFLCVLGIKIEYAVLQFNIYMNIRLKTTFTRS